VTNLFGRREVDEQARDWLVELDDEPPSSERLAELRAWLARSPLHRRAFEQAASAWRDMDCLAGMLKDQPGARGTAEARDLTSNQTPGLALDPTPGLTSDRSRTPRPSAGIFRGRAAVFAASATLLLAVIATSIALVWHPGAVHVTSSTYQTATGEITTIALSDGSKVHLNTASRVMVTYERKARILQLAAGEAYFEVAPDPQRPFIVYADRFAVRALGTAFAVHMLNTGVDLTVTQGQVELDSFRKPLRDLAGATPGGNAGPGEQAAEARYSLSGGQHLTFAGDVRLIEQIDAKGIEKRLAWRDGMLIFDDDPLEDVVAEIGRYTSARIVIADPSIRNLKIGGYFKVQDAGSILESLQENFGFEVRKDNDNVVYLARGRPAQ
jgi:transmembrane sensor